MDLIYQYYQLMPGTLDEIEDIWEMVKSIIAIVIEDWHKYKCSILRGGWSSLFPGHDSLDNNPDSKKASRFSKDVFSMLLFYILTWLQLLLVYT